jgi:membrane peptidoglycan carboxypeptidase
VFAIGTVGPAARRWTRRVLAWSAVAAAAVTAGLASWALVVWLRLPSVAGLGDEGDPGLTAFMLADSCPDGIRRTWRPLDEIDPRLACAVMLAEDRSFLVHDGIDWENVRHAARKNWRLGKIVAGGSTIPMQLARNLWLARTRSWTRKLQEAFLARRLVASYDRMRLLEIYLNAVELGPCTYGVEEGARAFFGHGAGEVDLAEASLLAYTLPRPSRPPSKRSSDRWVVLGKQTTLIHRVAGHAGLDEAETRAALDSLEPFWREPWQGRRPAPGPTRRDIRAAGDPCALLTGDGP